MSKIQSVLDLQSIKNVEAIKMADRFGGRSGIYKYQVVICGGTGCMSSDSILIRDEFVKQIKEVGLEKDVLVFKSGCFGLCEKGPVVIIFPEETFYSKMTVNDVKAVVQSHLVEGIPYSKKEYVDVKVKEEGKHYTYREMRFYEKQHRLTLRNCGFIDPLNIDEYIGRDGYFALGKCLNEYTPDQVIDIVKTSGLRGRGGAGFPTGLKWSFINRKPGQRYMICNADEGDPGAFMDRSILEGDPHCIIEAMIIGGYAIGASQGYVYVRAEYPVAVERLGLAINHAYEKGLLGKNILGSNFSFDLEMRLGAGAFVCGEETALIASIEGERGMPRNKPPFPANEGLWKRPTIINNVETYANIPQIILNGADWFAALGTEKSKGTKVFALGGKINNTGLLEVPMGTTLRDVIYEIGGGIPKNKKFKAVQTGGPSGGCLTEKHLDVSIDYDSLMAHGSMMGSGGMIVMDEDNCMVDIAKFFLEFTVDESCGKCTPCREGTKRMYEILEKITVGKGTMEDIRHLEELASSIKDSSLCALGQTAPNPITTTMMYFMDEYLAHVNEKCCPAGVCKELIKYYITDNCIGCSLCLKNCPANSISVSNKRTSNLKIEKYVHQIDTKSCIKCGACKQSCKFDAIITR